MQKTFTAILKLLEKPTFLCLILVTITMMITAQRFLLGNTKTYAGDQEYTHYNNYKIFSQSYFHLIQDKDLYQLYPEEHWDLFKYSPTFALLIAPLSYLPDVIGLSIWNLINVLVLFFAIWLMPAQLARSRLLILGFITIELITTLQNSQCNALIAGLVLLAFVLMEKRRPGWAALLIALTVYIKLFGLAAFALFMFYPEKTKAAAWSAGWLLILGLLPLLAVSPEQLLFLYDSWLSLLQYDHGASYGLSMMGWLSSWFNFSPSKNVVLAAGVALLLFPLLKWRKNSDLQLRLFFISSLLIWLVIFNHKAESATFIIAVCGVAIWYFNQARSWLNYTLVILVFLLTILSPTDLFPSSIRNTVVIPYALKAVPCILVWFKITYDLLTYELNSEPSISQ